MLIVDTDILIDIQRKAPEAVEWFTSLPEPPSVTGFSAMEMIQGARDSREVEIALNTIAPLPVLWPSAADCERARELYARAHLSHRLGLIDALIACTALGLNAELATFNVKHYRAVEGLRLVQPYQR